MILKSLPSLFTIANLVSRYRFDYYGILNNAKSEMAAMMVIIAMLMDGVDGRVARALGVQSEFGKELDSCRTSFRSVLRRHLSCIV